MTLGKTMRYYKSEKGKASYRKKLKEDVQRSTSAAGLKKRAELKRKRSAAKRAGKNIEGKDYDHKTNSFMTPKKNRGQREKSRLKRT